MLVCVCVCVRVRVRVRVRVKSCRQLVPYSYVFAGFHSLCSSRGTGGDMVFLTQAHPIPPRCQIAIFLRPVCRTCADPCAATAHTSVQYVFHNTLWNICCNSTTHCIAGGFSVTLTLTWSPNPRSVCRMSNLRVRMQCTRNLARSQPRSPNPSSIYSRAVPTDWTFMDVMCWLRVITPCRTRSHCARFCGDLKVPALRHHLLISSMKLSLPSVGPVTSPLQVVIPQRPSPLLAQTMSCPTTLCR